MCLSLIAGTYAGRLMSRGWGWGRGGILAPADPVRANSLPYSLIN